MGINKTLKIYISILLLSFGPGLLSKELKDAVVLATDVAKSIEESKLVNYDKCGETITPQPKELHFKYRGPKFCSEAGEEQSREIEKAFWSIQNPYWAAHKWWDRVRNKPEEKLNEWRTTYEWRLKKFNREAKADRDEFFANYKKIEEYLKKNDGESCLTQAQKDAWSSRCFFINNQNKMYAMKYHRPVRGGKDQWPVFFVIDVPGTKMSLQASNEQITHHKGRVSNVLLVKEKIPDSASTNPSIDRNSVGWMNFGEGASDSRIFLDNVTDGRSSKNKSGKKQNARLTYEADFKKSLKELGFNSKRNKCDIYKNIEKSVLTMIKRNKGWDPHKADKVIREGVIDRLASIEAKDLKEGADLLVESIGESWEELKGLGPMLIKLLTNAETPYPDGKNQCKKKENKDASPNNMCMGFRDILGNMLGENIFNPCYETMCNAKTKEGKIKCSLKLSYNPIAQVQFGACVLTQVGLKIGPGIAEKLKQCMNFSSVDKGFPKCMADLSVGTLSMLAGGGVAKGVSKGATVSIKALEGMLLAGKVSHVAARSMIIGLKVLRYPADKIVTGLTKPLPNPIAGVISLKKSLVDLLKRIKNARKTKLSAEELKALDEMEALAQKKMKEIAQRERKEAVKSASQRNAGVSKNAIKNSELDDVARRAQVEKDLMALTGKAPDFKKVDAVLRAHNDVPTKVGTTTYSDVKKKTKIMKDAGMSSSEIRLMLNEGLAGLPNPSWRSYRVPREGATKQVLGVDNDMVDLVYHPNARDYAIAARKIIEVKGEMPRLSKGTYTYAILEDGTKVFGKVDDGWEYGVKHVHLANGRPVIAAGEIKVGDFSTNYNLLSGSFTKKMIEAGIPESDIIKIAQDSLSGMAPKYVGRADLLPNKAPSIAEIRKLCLNALFVSYNKPVCSKLPKIDKPIINKPKVDKHQETAALRQSSLTDDPDGVGEYLRTFDNPEIGKDYRRMLELKAQRDEFIRAGQSADADSLNKEFTQLSDKLNDTIKANLEKMGVKASYSGGSKKNLMLSAADSESSDRAIRYMKKLEEHYGVVFTSSVRDTAELGAKGFAQDITSAGVSKAVKNQSGELVDKSLNFKVALSVNQVDNLKEVGDVLAHEATHVMIKNAKNNGKKSIYHQRIRGDNSTNTPESVKAYQNHLEYEEAYVYPKELHRQLRSMDADNFKSSYPKFVNLVSENQGMMSLVGNTSNEIVTMMRSLKMSMLRGKQKIGKEFLDITDPDKFGNRVLKIKDSNGRVIETDLVSKSERALAKTDTLEDQVKLIDLVESKQLTMNKVTVRQFQSIDQLQKDIRFFYQRYGMLTKAQREAAISEFKRRSRAIASSGLEGYKGFVGN